MRRNKDLLSGPGDSRIVSIAWLTCASISLDTSHVMQCTHPTDDERCVSSFIVNSSNDRPASHHISGVYLPGDRQCNVRVSSVPRPGFGQVLVQTRASGLCGSDLRSIYRPKTHKTGAEGYLGVIAGHEPCGVIVKRGEGILDV